MSNFVKWKYVKLGNADIRALLVAMRWQTPGFWTPLASLSLAAFSGPFSSLRPLIKPILIVLVPSSMLLSV